LAARKKHGLKEWALIVSIATGTLTGLGFVAKLASVGERAFRAYIVGAVVDSLECCKNREGR